MAQPDFTVEFLDPSDLSPHGLNFRRHSAPQRTALDASLKEHGWLSAPIVNRRTGMRIIDGHARVELALSEGQATVPCRVIDVPEEQEKRILRAFDQIGAMADEDTEALDRLIAEINDADLERLLGELEEEGGGSGLVEGADEDAIPEDAQTRCQVGDVWELGWHRIGCLDSRDEEQVRRLVADDKPGMVFADPPYGVDIVQVSAGTRDPDKYGYAFGGVKNGKRGTVGAAKPFGSGAVRGSVGASNLIDVGKYAPIIGDETTDTAVTACTLCASLWPDAVQVWWGGNYYANALPPSSCWLVWDKENTGNFADAELAWTNQKTAVRIFRHMWNGLMKDSERGEKRVHPTQKPVALAEWVFTSYGKEGDTIFDPFLGSGMSLIAAEKIGRRLIGAELSPEYMDIAVERWQRATGREGKLLARSA